MKPKQLIATLIFLAAGAQAAHAQWQFMANFHVAHEAMNHNADAGGVAHLTLSADQTQLTYTIDLYGVDFEPDPSKRGDPDDVFGMHLHQIVPGQIGLHVLNIFGNPAEEDADVVWDYDAERVSGVFTDDDATRNPDTGELEPQFFPLTTKLLSEWDDNLLRNGLYLAVHTWGENGGPLLHGDVVLVPEPAAASLAGGVLLAALRRRRRASAKPRHCESKIRPASI